jgi:hypothetical protein
MAETKEVVVRGGIKTAQTKRPFWVSDEEKKGLSTTPPDNLDVASAIPALTCVEAGSLVGAYTRKDGLVIYHVYKKDRKEIYDAAHEALAKTRDPAAQQEISRRANQDLEEHPWWPDTVVKLHEVFSEHFKHHPNKITYFPEVDSWSVILPEPTMPAALAPQYLKAALSKLALSVDG